MDAPSASRALRHIVALAVFAVGVAAAVWIVRHVGWSAVAASLARLGLGGLLFLCGYTLLVYLLLGLAWFVIAPGLKARTFVAFAGGRLVREAAADTLPFSQLGGIVVGARAAVVFGAPSVPAIAASMIDLWTELVGQLFFTATGFAILLVRPPARFPFRTLDPALLAAFVLCAATAIAFIIFQRKGLGLVERIGGSWPEAMRAQFASVRASVQEMNRRHGRSAASVLLHFLAWLAATVAVWLVLPWMGAAVPLASVVALESLIYLLRSVAFFVPGALGVLEGGYVALGPVFGIPPDVALGLSLVKRGRDLVLGLPALGLWQAMESRRLLT